MHTRDRILQAAIKVFADKGFSAATTSQIAVEAGVAEGTIFRYFPKKIDLLYGILYEAIDTFEEVAAFRFLKKTIMENKDKPVEELLKQIMLERADFFNKWFPLLQVVINEVQYHEELRLVFIEKFIKKYIEIGKDLIKLGKSTGELRDEIDDFVAVRSLMGMVIMMLVQRKFIPEEKFSEQIEEELQMILDIYLNGVRSKEVNNRFCRIKESFN